MEKNNILQSHFIYKINLKCFLFVFFLNQEFDADLFSELKTTTHGF